MTLSRVLRGALVGAVAASVVLSGCTTDEPTPTPTATSAAPTGEPTAEPTTEPTQIVPPEPPPVMATNDAIGARAAAEYFLSLHGYVLQSGDLSEWDAMCHAESVFCQSVRERVAADAQAGQHLTGGEVTTVIETVTEPSPAVEFFEVAGVLTQAPSETLGSDGAVVDSRPLEEKVTFSVFLSMSPQGKWIIRAVDIGESN